MNHVTLIGRLATDAELRYTPNNKAVANTRIAVNRDYREADGSRKADFFPVVIWGKNAENFADYTCKGSLVAVQGQLQTRNYEDQNGVRRYVTEVIVSRWENLEPRSKDENGGDNNYPDLDGIALDIDPDNLPF